MNKKSFENEVVDARGIKEGTNLENGYQHYLELGGIINEADYESALARAKNITTLDGTLIAQAELIAKVSGIELRNTKDTIDRRTILYGILRTDTTPKEVQYHHSQMSDQRIFGEVLRMLGDADSLDKLIKAHPNISFEYKRGE
ncbi:MAG: hypothetical protein Q7S09_01115 [bacterium]|nr:hypothetical protein [bacterium]